MEEAGEAKRAYQVVQRSVPKLLVPVHERQVIGPARDLDLLDSASMQDQNLSLSVRTNEV